MFLSSEQRRAVMHGTTATRVKEWDYVPLPTHGRVPDWALDLHVNWMLGYANSPSYTVLARSNPHTWRDQRWFREGARWMTRHSDGRAKVHWHSGTVAWCDIPEMVRVKPVNPPNKTFARRDRKRLVTTQQEGYAGSGFEVHMSEVEKDPLLRGQKVLLRGPWQGAAPAGYVEVSTVERDRRRISKRPKWHRRWYRETACFGLVVTEELFLKLVARFLPHLAVVQVEYGDGRTKLQLTGPELGWMPKDIWLAQQRNVK